MAGQITGKFIGDFTAFNDAVNKAVVHLKGMETGASKVQTGLERMVNQFSGQKIIQEAQLLGKTFELLAEKGIGLTTAELQKMGSVGSAAIEKLKASGEKVPPEIQKIVDAANKVKPAMDSAQSSTAGLLSTVQKAAGIFGIAFSAQALVGFVGKVFDTASAIKDLSESLGLSTDEVQKFKFAAQQGGGSLDDVGNSIRFMQQKLVEGSKETAAALDNLGLKLNEVRQQSPGEALLTVTDALKDMENPAQRTTTQIDLLGKASKGLGPTIASGFREASEAADFMSKQTVEDLEKAQQAWENLSNTVVIVSGNIIAGSMRAVKESTSSWQKFLIFAGNVSTMGIGPALALANATSEAASAATDLANEGGKVPPVLGKTKAEMEAAAEAAKKLKEAWETYIAGALKRGDAMITYLKQFETGLKNVDETMGKFVTGHLKELGDRGVKILNLTSDAAVKLSLDMAGLHPVVTGLSKEFMDFTATGIHAARNLPPEIKKAKFEIDDLSKAITQMATVAGDSFGVIASGLATLVTAANTLKQSFKQIGEGIKAKGFEGFLGIASGITGITTAALAAGQAIVKMWKHFGNAGRDAIKTFAAGKGGFDKLHEQLGELGKEGEELWIKLTQGTARNNPQAAAAAIEEVEQALEKHVETQKKLNLELATTPKALNEMVRAAALAGTGLDSAMTKYIEDLIEAGDLTEENKNLLLGLPEAGVPSFKEVEDAAERLGLNIDSIGQSIKQMGFIDAASAVAADLDLLARAGADMTAVLQGSRDKIQKLVDDAQKYGYSLPESIKPFLQQMVDSGELTDALGEKLGDLDDLHFEKPLADSVEDLIEAMRELVGVIKDEVGGALDELGNKVISPKINLPSADAITAGNNGNGGANITVVSTLDGREIARSTARHLPDVLEGIA